MLILRLFAGVLVRLPGARATVGDARVDVRIEEDELRGPRQHRCNQVAVAAFDHPPLVRTAECASPSSRARRAANVDFPEPELPITAIRMRAA